MNVKRQHRKIKRWVIRAGLVLFSTAIGLLLAELGMRLCRLAPAVKPITLTDDTSVYQRSHNPLLAYELKANYRNAHADCVLSYPSTNAFGQRDVERTLGKAPNMRRILLLGDSVVEGLGIRKLEDTMSAQLERLLGAAKTEVLNFGVSGYNTRAEVELLREKGVQFDPDQVILVFVSNDFDNFNREALELAVTRERPAWAQSLFLSSHLFRWLSLQYNWFQFTAQNDPITWSRRAMGDNNVVKGLEQLKQLGQQHSFDCLIAIWPRFTDDAIQDLPLMPGQQDVLVIESLAADLGIPTLRLSSFYRDHWKTQSPRQSPRLLYTNGDQLHPSKNGCRLAAQAIKTALDESATLVPKAPAPGKEAVGLTALDAAKTLGINKPNYARVHYNQARSLASQGDQNGAISKYEDALSADPNFEMPYINLAILLASQGQLDRAIELLRAVIKLKPFFADAHANLGIVLDLKGKKTEALHHLREAVQLKPGSAAFHHNLGEMLLGMRKVDEAMAQFRQALALDPDLTVARLNLGIGLAQKGELKQAEAQFRSILQKHPGHKEATSYLNKVLGLLSRQKKGV